MKEQKSQIYLYIRSEEQVGDGDKSKARVSSGVWLFGHFQRHVADLGDHSLPNQVAGSDVIKCFLPFPDPGGQFT